MGTCSHNCEWKGCVKYLAANFLTFEMLWTIKRPYFAVSVARSVETHMFVSGHAGNTVAKVGAAGSCISRATEMLF